MKGEKYQLFLLHFAGGSASSFDFLKNYLDAYFDFIPLELPGRGRRLKEELLRDKGAAVQDYYEQIKSLRNNQPYLIYGHSMGATLSLRLTRLLEKRGDPPFFLFVSGNPGPDAKKLVKKNKVPRHLMNDEDFKEDLRELGGVPEVVMENEELFDFFSTILRADFELLETDNFSEQGLQLEVPIYALMGTEEKDCEQIENWKRFTTRQFHYQTLSGGHFFIYDHPAEIANLIKAILKKYCLYFY